MCGSRDRIKCAAFIKPRGAVGTPYRALRRRRCGFRLGKHQMYKEMCRYSENHGTSQHGVKKSQD